MDALLEYWFEDGKLNQEMLKIVKELQSKGIKCGLCSNNEKLRIDYLKKNFRIDELFDFAVFSFEVGARKPDKEMFKRVLAHTNAEPGEVLFCDDQEKIILAAKEFGFKTYKYRGISNFKDTISQIKNL